MSVQVYTTPSCGYCRMVKSYFQERGVKFTEYDVSRDRNKADEMVRKSGQMGVPVVDINGKIIVGFDRDRIERSLRA